MRISPIKKIKGQLVVPGDKSISHRAVMLGSIAKGETSIKGFLHGEDCLSTIDCFRNMGIPITINNKDVVVKGKGLHGLTQPNKTLLVGNSGTTLRILTGLLAAQSFECTITGDASIITRPMKRIMEPLSKMGANIVSIHGNDKAPLQIIGTNLESILYHSPVASAQVKSSIMLASLYTENTTKIVEPIQSRNHTEIMLNYFGGNVEAENSTITCTPVKQLYGREVIVPGDISSAAYFIVAGLILPDSEILIKNVGINKTRNGIITILQKMNGHIELLNQQVVNGERIADILVKSSQLTATTVDKEIIPTLIDEIPIIAVAACFAEGTTIIKDASELRVKECDRIEAMVTELQKMGADITGTEDGMIINGTSRLNGSKVSTYHDHRVAMSLTIAGLKADTDTTIEGSACINVSYPTFFNDLTSLC